MCSDAISLIDDISGLNSREHVYLDIPESHYFAKPCATQGKWRYEKAKGLSPEELVSRLLEDNGYEILFHEGSTIREFYSLMCHVAHWLEQPESIYRSKNGKTSLVQKTLLFSAPSAPYTLSHIQSVLNTDDLYDVRDYIETYGSCLSSRSPYGFIGEEFHNLMEFLTVFSPKNTSKLFCMASRRGKTLAGWPDITAVKDGHVFFIEVKTTDFLTPKQKEWIELYQQKMSLNYTVIRVKSY